MLLYFHVYFCRFLNQIAQCKILQPFWKPNIYINSALFHVVYPIYLSYTYMFEIWISWSYISIDYLKISHFTRNLFLSLQHLFSGKCQQYVRIFYCYLCAMYCSTKVIVVHNCKINCCRTFHIFSEWLHMYLFILHSLGGFCNLNKNNTQYGFILCSSSSSSSSCVLLTGLENHASSHLAIFNMYEFMCWIHLSMPCKKVLKNHLSLSSFTTIIINLPNCHIFNFFSPHNVTKNVDYNFLICVLNCLCVLSFVQGIFSTLG